MSKGQTAGVTSLLAFATLATLLSACADDAPTCGPADGVVTDVIDGDTIVLASGEHVRYLLVDTPESTAADPDCFGHNAARFNRDLVLDRHIELRYDAAACDDRFGRHLAYVSVDGQDVNQLLLERGYACLLYLPPGGANRVDTYRAAESRARDAHRGLWGACEAPCS